MTYKVLEMKKFFTDNYKLHAGSEMEHVFVATGETDQEKRKSSLSFVKRMSALEQPLDELFQKQGEVLKSFSDFEIIYKMGSNEVAFYSLASLYSKLEKSLKDFNKSLKKHSNQPEIVEYFKEAEPYLSTNVFNLMKEDFDLFETVTVERMNEHKARFPDFNNWDSPVPDWEIVKERYKGK